MEWMYIFFGFIGVCLILLFIINIVAKKYLNGDFVKLPPEDIELVNGYDNSAKIKSPLKQKEDEGLLTQNNCQDDILKQSNNDTENKGIQEDISLQECFSEQAALVRIKSEVFSNAFASRTKVKLRFQYEKERSVISGMILSVDGLIFHNIETCPDVICFHIKMIPNLNTCKTRTMWKAASVRTLGMPFSLGPLKNNIDPTTVICFRLYGKTKVLTARAKCYGECSVSLNYVTTSNGVLEVYREFLPETSKNKLTESSPLLPGRKPRVSGTLAQSSTDSDCDFDCHRKKEPYHRKTFERESMRDEVFNQ